MKSTTMNNDVNAIKELREFFNEHRSILNRDERNKIRKKIHNFLKEGSLTNKQKNSLKNLKKYLEKYLKKYSKRFRKYNTTYDLDYLFNEVNEPTKIQHKSIKEVRDLFNERRSSLNCEEVNRIRKKLNKLYRKGAVYNFLKEKEQKDGLPNNEKKLLKNI